MKNIELFAEPTHIVDPITGAVMERKPPVKLPPMSDPRPVIRIKDVSEFKSELENLQWRVTEVRHQRDTAAGLVKQYAEKEGQLNKLLKHYQKISGNTPLARQRLKEIDLQLDHLTNEAELSRTWLPRYENILRDAEQRLAQWQRDNGVAYREAQEVAKLEAEAGY
jgi:predicted  nucleic acid-binding Zn-ribbon protein